MTEPSLLTALFMDNAMKFFLTVVAVIVALAGKEFGSDWWNARRLSSKGFKYNEFFWLDDGDMYAVDDVKFTTIVYWNIKSGKYTEERATTFRERRVWRKKPDEVYKQLADILAERERKLNGSEV